MSIRTYFENIAEAIRTVTGGSDTYTPAEMPDAIENITPPISHTFQITVTGGYNGGAVITVKYNGNSVFTATGNSPYNLAYNPSGGSFLDANGNTVNITINPPTSSAGKLVIELSGGIIYNTGEISPTGSNTSYGYNYDSGIITV